MFLTRSNLDIFKPVNIIPTGNKTCPGKLSKLNKNRFFSVLLIAAQIRGKPWHLSSHQGNSSSFYEKCLQII